MQIDAEGSQPHPWSVRLSFIPDPGASIGMVKLMMHERAVSDRSEDLCDAFRSVHSGDNTSYACVHPWDNWIRVRGREPPLINSATFQTVLWANFIGPDLMRRFDRERLKNLEADASEWTTEGGLFLRLSKNAPDISPSDTKKELENSRQSLARRFKSVRSY